MSDNAIILRTGTNRNLVNKSQSDYPFPDLKNKSWYTVKGVKRYASAVENTCIEYLKNIVHRDQASLKLIVTQSDKELFKQDKNVKNNFFKSAVNDRENFMIVSCVFLITLLLSSVGIFNFIDSYQTEFEESLMLMIFLFVFSAAFSGFISFFFFKEVNFMRKTGYSISIFSKIRSQKINNLAITDKAVYVSYKNFENGLYHKKYEYREIAHLKTDATSNGNRLILAFNHKDEILFEILCDNDNFEQVLNELEDNKKKGEIDVK